MPKKNFTAEEIIGKLREAEVLLNQVYARQPDLSHLRFRSPVLANGRRHAGIPTGLPLLVSHALTPHSY